MLLEERVARPTTEAEAVKLARELYGLAVTAKSLPGEYDDNFHLTTLDRAAEDRELAGFVLKVMHPARERAFIDMQCRGLEHLALKAARLTLPRVQPNRNGDAFAAVRGRRIFLLCEKAGAASGCARPPGLWPAYIQARSDCG